MLEEFNPSTSIFFGLGLVTFLSAKFVDKMVLYETDESKLETFASKLAKYPHIETRLWNGKIISSEDLDKYDFAFVDDPPGGKNREFSIKLAGECSSTVMVHDAGRDWEKKWQEKHLENKEFELESKGGHRCSFWLKDGYVAPKSDKIKKRPPTVKIEKRQAETYDRPNVRLISTARGWGGCARSITTIMSFLTKQGHKVEFVPFHSKYKFGEGIGNDFRRCLEKDLTDVIVRDYRAITEPTDLTFIYFSFMK